MTNIGKAQKLPILIIINNEGSCPKELQSHTFLYLMYKYWLRGKHPVAIASRDEVECICKKNEEHHIDPSLY